MNRTACLPGAIFLGVLGGAWLLGAEPETLTWGECQRRQPEWYAGDEAVRIADNVLLYQRDSGGWPKNVDMARPLSDADKARLRREKKNTDSTLDNSATYTQIRYLARVYNAAKDGRFKEGCLAGVDYLLRAQYPNGGWPQYYPIRRGYSRHITLNDDAMVGALNTLLEIVKKKPLFAFADEDRRQRARAAIDKGIECILQCQVIVAGKRTAWCAQHDEKTFEPRPARSYEKASLSGNESVGVVKFLMRIDRPSPEIIEAVQSAVTWFDRAKITGIRQVRQPAPAKLRGFDTVIVPDPDAPPLWARFYDIGTNRPIFCSRDGVIRHRLSEISHERRTGYSWYGYYAANLLSKDYPLWQKRWAPGTNVLKP